MKDLKNLHPLYFFSNISRYRQEITEQPKNLSANLTLDDIIEKNTSLNQDEIKEKNISNGMNGNDFLILLVYGIVYLVLLIAAFYYVSKTPRYVSDPKSSIMVLHYIILVLSLIFANPFWIIYYIYLIYTGIQGSKK